MKKSFSLVILSVILSISALFCVVFATSAAAEESDTTLLATFKLGADGSASHADGSSKSSYTETVNDYKLNITNGTNMYTGARDAKGNSCIKFGASSKAGSCKFTVPDDVVQVKIYIAKYKANTAKVSVNGTTKTLSCNSNDGKYDVIEVDTSSSKTVEIKTLSGGYRAMLNTIEFYGELQAGDCSHSYTETVTKPATCTDTGIRTKTCSLCEDSSEIVIPALGHDFSVKIDEESVESTCETKGCTVYKCSRCDEKQSVDEPIAPHSYVDGKCEVCQKAAPVAEFTFGENSTKPDATEGTSSDGSDLGNSKSYTVTGTDGKSYVLALSGLSKVYGGAYDALGNSCLKLGTGSVAATATFTVPDGIDEIVIFIAGYKGNKASIKVNGTTYNISTYSSNGEYTEITVDTSVNKTVTLETTGDGTLRAKINTIEFYAGEYATIDGASLTAGSDLTLNYEVTIPEGHSADAYEMVFCMNEKIYTVKGVMVGEKLVFSFKHIGPQSICDEVDADLLYNGESVDVLEGYSIKQFAADFYKKYGEDEAYAAYITLLGDILAYGEAASKYIGWNEDGDFSVDGLGSSDKTPEDNVGREISDSKSETVYFTGAGVRFHVDNKIFVKFVGEAELYLNGSLVQADDGVFYTDGILASDFDEIFTFALVVDGETVQTLKYSVNAYALAKYQADSTMGRLALALYRYGASSEAIVSKAD